MGGYAVVGRLGRAEHQVGQICELTGHDCTVPPNDRGWARRLADAKGNVLHLGYAGHAVGEEIQ